MFQWQGNYSSVMAITSTIYGQPEMLLRSEGFFTENLWSVHDVLQTHDCSRGKAYDVLDKAMNNSATIEQIFLAIDDVCDDLEIKKIND